MDFKKEASKHDDNDNDNDDCDEGITIKYEKRGSKSVTYLTGMKGSNEELKCLAKHFKSKLCHCTGCYKNGDIKLSGDQRSKIFTFLTTTYGVSEDDIIVIGT
jgi:translation initiation factor 1 (eIF-1/SUI1)